jgi:hypothetical protein
LFQFKSIGISQRGVRERIVKHLLAIQRRGGIGKHFFVWDLLFVDFETQLWETTMYKPQGQDLSLLGSFMLTKGQELLTGEDPEGSTSGAVILRNEGNQGIGRNTFKLTFTFSLAQQKMVL